MSPEPHDSKKIAHPCEHMKKPPYEFAFQVFLTKKCNLKCVYCFANQWPKLERIKYFLGLISNYFWLHSGALPKFLERQDKVCRVEFSGGEPFLLSNFTQMCKKITGKHFIGIMTNNTLPQTRIFADTIDPSRVIFINASVHFMQLEVKKLFSAYIDNFLYFRKKGFNISAAAVAYPVLFKHADKYINMLKAAGIEVAWTPFYGCYKGVDYPYSYSDEEKKYFKFNNDIIALRNVKGRLCNAGYSAAILGHSGIFHPCFGINKNIGTVYGRIRLSSSTVRCPSEQCSCPLYLYWPELLPSTGEKTV